MMKRFFYQFIHAGHHMIRPIFGPHGVCIYPISCTDYIPALFKEYSFFKACLYAIARLISCNPLVGWYLWRKKKSQ